MAPMTKLSLVPLPLVLAAASGRAGPQYTPKCCASCGFVPFHHAMSVTTDRGLLPHLSYSLPPTNNIPPRKSRQPKKLTLLTKICSTPSETIANNPDDSSNASERARQLRQRARELRLEAISAEQSLRNSMQQKKEAKNMEADRCIEILLGVSTSSDVPGGEPYSIPNAQTLVIRMKENNLGVDKLMNVVDRLHERETCMIMGPEGYLSRQDSTEEGGFVLGDYENNSLEYKQEEVKRLSGLLDRILEAVAILDQEKISIHQTDPSEWGSKLRVRVADLRKRRDALVQRRVAVLVNSSQIDQPSNDGVEDYAKSSIDGEGDSPNKSRREKQISKENIMKRLIETPAWLPTSLAALAATSSVEVSPTHWKMIKTDLLADSEFTCMSWDSTDVAAVFRGRLSRRAANDEQSRERSITTMFINIQSRLENHLELKDRIQLFLVDDNEWLPTQVNGSYDAMRLSGRGTKKVEGPPPVIIALAKNVVPEQETERSLATKSLAVVSTMLTAFTTLAYALSSWALNPTFFNSVVNENDATALQLCLPIFIGFWAVSALHEAGHFVGAKRHGTKLGLPVPLPSLQVGTFGSITPLRSFPPSRAAMFDIAIGGPSVSMLVSLILLISGLNLTVTSQSLATLPMVPAAMMKSSLLIGFIVSIVSPLLLLVPLSQPVPIHPFFLVGLAGLVMSAVNMLPIGRLDGGRACMAVFGRRVASLVSFLSLLMLAIYSFTSLSGIAVFWGALVILTKQRFSEIPCIDEVTSAGENRTYTFIALSALALLILLPYPGGIGPI